MNLPYENVQFIYEGPDPTLLEPLSSIVLNRAPKQIQQNVEFLKNQFQLYKDSINSLLGNGKTQTYDPEQIYPAGAVVTYNGKNYISLQDNNDQLPTNTDYWKQIEQISIPTTNIQNTNPTVDNKLPYGTLWVNITDGSLWIQESTDENNPQWVQISGKSTILVKDTDPTNTDQYDQGTLWVNSNTLILWVQISEDKTNPNWQKISGSSSTGSEQELYSLYTYTAKGGETEIDFTHIQHYITVTLNGVVLYENVDYIDNDNTKITLNNPLNKDDNLIVYVWNKIAVSSGSSLTATYVSDDYNANPSEFLIVDTSSKSISITLPQNPNDMDIIRIADGTLNAQNNPVIVYGNGKNINGVTDNLSCDVNGFEIDIYFNGSKNSWYIMNNN